MNQGSARSSPRRRRSSAPHLIRSNPLPSFHQTKNPHLSVWVLFGGDNRTRTCDLMRVKQPRDFRPVWKGQFPTKTLENTRLFSGLPWQAAFLFCYFDLMPSRCQEHITPAVQDTSPQPYFKHIQEHLATRSNIREHLQISPRGCKHLHNQKKKKRK